MFKIRASSLGKIMASAKSKKDEDLSVGALTHCYELAKQHVYEYEDEIASKYVDKGNLCEEDSISLYNLINLSDFKKNTERRENEFLSGECDIVTPDRIVDIKTAWSKKTFPAIQKQVHDVNYEWQGRAYMMLFDKDLFQLAYCLVSTPLNLIGHESENLHYVEDIDPSLRVKVKNYARDKELDKKIEIKCRAAQEQIFKFIEEIKG